MRNCKHYTVNSKLFKSSTFFRRCTVRLHHSVISMVTAKNKLNMKRQGTLTIQILSQESNKTAKTEYLPIKSREKFQSVSSCFCDFFCCEVISPVLSFFAIEQDLKQEFLGIIHYKYFVTFTVSLRTYILSEQKIIS